MRLRVTEFEALRLSLLNWRGGENASSLNDIPPNELVDHIQRIVAAAANNHIVSVLCFPRSLTFSRELAKRGYASNIVIGVKKINSELESHAWVESLDGTVLNDSPDYIAGFRRIVQGV